MSLCAENCPPQPPAQVTEAFLGSARLLAKLAVEELSGFVDGDLNPPVDMIRMMLHAAIDMVAPRTVVAGDDGCLQWGQYVAWLN